MHLPRLRGVGSKYSHGSMMALGRTRCTMASALELLLSSLSSVSVRALTQQLQSSASMLHLSEGDREC